MAQLLDVFLENLSREHQIKALLEVSHDRRSAVLPGKIIIVSCRFAAARLQDLLSQLTVAITDSENAIPFEGKPIV